MNFSLPLLLMLLVMEHWLLTHFQYGEMSPVTSGNLFSGSLSPLAQQTEICPFSLSSLTTEITIYLLE